MVSMSALARTTAVQVRRWWLAMDGVMQWFSNQRGWLCCSSVLIAHGNPMLRAGDTGLLDHLLKHLTDQVVTPAGERLLRRHNEQGHMEYWLQLPAAPEPGARRFVRRRTCMS